MVLRTLLLCGLLLGVGLPARAAQLALPIGHGWQVVGGGTAIYQDGLVKVLLEAAPAHSSVAKECRELPVWKKPNKAAAPGALQASVARFGKAKGRGDKPCFVVITAPSLGRPVPAVVADRALPKAGLRAKVTAQLAGAPSQKRFRQIAKLVRSLLKSVKVREGQGVTIEPSPSMTVPPVNLRACSMAVSPLPGWRPDLEEASSAFRFREPDGLERLLVVYLSSAGEPARVAQALGDQGYEVTGPFARGTHHVIRARHPEGWVLERTLVELPSCDRTLVVDVGGGAYPVWEGQFLAEAVTARMFKATEGPEVLAPWRRSGGAPTIFTSPGSDQVLGRWKKALTDKWTGSGAASRSGPDRGSYSVGQRKWSVVFCGDGAFSSSLRHEMHVSTPSGMMSNTEHENMQGAWALVELGGAPFLYLATHARGPQLLRLPTRPRKAVLTIGKNFFLVDDLQPSPRCQR